jgi:hypothetical protein
MSLYHSTTDILPKEKLFSFYYSFFYIVPLVMV